MNGSPDQNVFEVIVSRAERDVLVSFLAKDDVPYNEQQEIGDQVRFMIDLTVLAPDKASAKAVALRSMFGERLRAVLRE